MPNKKSQVLTDIKKKKKKKKRSPVVSPRLTDFAGLSPIRAAKIIERIHAKHKQLGIK